MEAKVIRRNRGNAKTIFAGIPARFHFAVNGRFFPYSREAYAFAHELVREALADQIKQSEQQLANK